MAFPPFLNTVLDTIRRRELLPRGGAVVCAFSGGADSTALLRALLDLAPELGLAVTAAHLDHALRDGSADDAAWARERAESWNVPFATERVDWATRGGFPESNREARARDERYAFLHRVASAHGATIAVGHHATDRIESLLVQLLRGAGPRGLSLPRARREDGVIRPLFDCSAEAVRAFLRERDIDWREDPTNTDGSNLRGRLRNGVLPLLRRENPELERAAARTADLLAAVDDHLRAEADALLTAWTREDGAAAASTTPSGEMTLDRPSGRPYDPVVLATVLRSALRRIGGNPAEIGFESIDRCVRAWRDGDRCTVDVPGGFRVSVEADTVRIAPRASDFAASLSERELPVPGRLSLPGPGAHLTARELPPPADPARVSSGRVAWVDAEKVAGPLTLRGRRPGDRYRPIGLGGAAKVQDLMTDRKIARRLRGTVPIIADGLGIVWIPGFRVDERTRITEETRRVIRLELAGSAPFLRGDQSMNPETVAPIGNVLISEDKLRARVRELGRELSAEYRGKCPICVNILKGGFIFLADLVRAMDVDCEMDFMVVSSYEDKTDSSGVVRILSDLGLNIEGRHVLIVEDIVDTGLTLEYLRELLQARNPASLKIVALLDKTDRRRVEVPIDWVGFPIPDEFVVGYGLDFAQRFRNLPYITVLDENDLPTVGLDDAGASQDGRHE
jgi:hypoxanthine phosphoribosyltransferase